MAKEKKETENEIAFELAKKNLQDAIEREKIKNKAEKIKLKRENVLRWIGLIPLSLGVYFSSLPGLTIVNFPATVAPQWA